MFGLIVTFVQIAAILVCPLSCGLGQCDSSSCCAGETALVRAYCSENSCGCCCDKVKPSDEKMPPTAPIKTECQGICGGAIFEKACELPAETAIAFLSPIDFPSNDLIRSEIRLADGHEVSIDGGNYGRSLRTLHASFLC